MCHLTSMKHPPPMMSRTRIRRQIEMWRKDQFNVKSIKVKKISVYINYMSL